MRKWKCDILLSFIWIIAGLGGCIGPVTEPVSISPTFNGSEIDTIYMMPALEFSSEALRDLDGCIWKGAKEHFKIKGYKLVRLNDKSLVNGIKRNDFSVPNTSVLRNIGPAEARWLLFFVLYEEVSTNLVIPDKWITRDEIILKTTKEPTFRLSAYLFDKSKGEMVWSNGCRVGKIPTHDGVIIATAVTMNGLPYK